ncbi:helix-turn-helix transcriptional regulator [Mycolicibacterium sp. F2034L]|uniref:helix-turn-helix transcriptional regulator n=1 Tax=Mycolicibacterium sp. F2034L TaxID=2926422 RepID=UPI001FF5883F|nr:helix-turn-helix transcriptional regulator [Mycolicibacterium sp. F2034L]MCK0174768.1 helix-turn-helix domain-containing protein [Mycolicibacterium sp. F2034L]
MVTTSTISRRRRPPTKRREYWMRVTDPARIRRQRKFKRFSQRELAYLVRRTQSTIYLIETGKLRDISEDLALAIAARLDVPWEDLFEARESSSVPGVGHDSCDTSQVAEASA